VRNAFKLNLKNTSKPSNACQPVRIGCSKVLGKLAVFFGQIARTLLSFKQINQRVCHSELVRNLRPKASNKTFILAF
jgi:hypothetical protein